MLWNKRNHQADPKKIDPPPKRRLWRRALITPFGWLIRMTRGAGRILTELPNAEAMETPLWLTVRRFWKRRSAVAALIVLILLFALVFVGPLLFPMDVNETNLLQANVAPTLSLSAIPRELRGQIRDVNGYASFTVGVGKDGRIFLWGYTKDRLSGIDYADLPKELQDKRIVAAAAGYDHLLAVTEDGRVVGWGNNSRGQYGDATGDDDVVPMPREVREGGIDVSKLTQLTCGYQASAMIVDGRLYLWGNTNALLNLRELNDAVQKYTAAEGVGVKKLVFSGYYAIVLFEDGSVTGSNLLFHRESAISSTQGKISNFKSYLDTQKTVDIAATDNCFAFLLSDGEILINGATRYGEDKIPTPTGQEKFVSLASGTRHFVALTDRGHVWAWGQNDGGQASVSGIEAERIFTGAKQTYLTDAEGKLLHKSGRSAYPFGTDQRGRDIFTRIVHGGKMTMTIGAVAVIVSTLIAVTVGCLAGYFGGWVDLLLMRMTEIFSAIPFLPFAMLLSFVLRYYPVGETARIFLIMLILGLLSWTGLARIVRGQVLAEREKEFILAAKAMGVREGRIAFRHILPNVVSVILVSMTLDFAGCLLTESALSYLGFGVQQPMPTWGNMLSGANSSIVIQNYPWFWGFPALFLALATVSINIIGDALRDALDPKGHGKGL